VSGRFAFSPGRVGAMVLRHWYVLRSSVPRLLEIIYWPAVSMLTWGFLQVYVADASGRAAFAAGTFIGGVLLWDILFRGGLGFSITFLEEMWAHNVGNLMMSPLRPAELIASLAVMSVVRLLIGMIPVTLLAIAFFGFNLWAMGLALAAFFVNLILTSWAMSLAVSGLVLRYGLGAESLAWTVMFVLMPVCAVYYPVAIMPDWLQMLAWALPPTYVFEGMRELLLHNVFRGELMIEAFLINLGFFAVAALIFAALLERARNAGSLLLTGE
jgi:ABC-2 type transport system permease protein